MESEDSAATVNAGSATISMLVRKVNISRLLCSNGKTVIRTHRLRIASEYLFFLQAYHHRVEEESEHYGKGPGWTRDNSF
jgi:hypothetical protein